MKRILLMSAAVLMMAALSASAGDAKETFAKACAKCHGPDGKGDTKMGKKAEVKDFSDAKIQASFKDEDLLKAIKEGVKDGDKTRMKPAENVSDDEIKALVAYVRTLKK